MVRSKPMPGAGHLLLFPKTPSCVLRADVRGPTASALLVTEEPVSPSGSEGWGGADHSSRERHPSGTEDKPA